MGRSGTAEHGVVEISGPDREENEDSDGSPDYLLLLREVILEKDDDRQPVGMMGSRWANLICRDVDEPGPHPLIGPNARRGCAKRKAEQDFREDVSDLSFKLQENTVQRTKLCQQTPADKRSKVEAQACEEAEAQVKWVAELAVRDAEAKRLLANPAVLDVKCKGLKIRRFQTVNSALEDACQKRGEDLHSKEHMRLLTLMERNPAEYDRRCHFKYAQSVSEDPLEEACASIESSRHMKEWEAGRKALAAMSPTEIAARCAAIEAKEAAAKAAPSRGVPMVRALDADESLRDKCRSLKSARDESEWKLIEKDPKRLEETCAKAVGDYDNPYKWHCESIEDDRLDNLAWPMAKDHPALVAACQATPTDQRDKVLAMACERYRQCVIVPIDTPLPEKNMYRADTPLTSGGDAETIYTKGRHGDGLGQYCYETTEEASAAWAFAHDPVSGTFKPPVPPEPLPPPPKLKGLMRGATTKM